jgi:hypothetical protein
MNLGFSGRHATTIPPRATSAMLVWNECPVFWRLSLPPSFGTVSETPEIYLILAWLIAQEDLTSIKSEELN